MDITYPIIDLNCWIRTGRRVGKKYLDILRSAEVISFVPVLKKRRGFVSFFENVFKKHTTFLNVDKRQVLEDCFNILVVRLLS